MAVSDVIARALAKGLTIAAGLFTADGREIISDQSTRAFVTITYPHHEVHAGSHFLYTDSVELNNGSSQKYLITTPDTTKWAHTIFRLDGSAITMFQLCEGADRVGDAAATAGNSNRNSATTPTVTIHKGITGAGSTDGTCIHQWKGGSATNQAKIGGEAGNSEEIILKQNTKYVLTITSYTNANLCNINIGWYEHTDKE